MSCISRPASLRLASRRTEGDTAHRSEERHYHGRQSLVGDHRTASCDARRYSPPSPHLSTRHGQGTQPRGTDFPRRRSFDRRTEAPLRVEIPTGIGEPSQPRGLHQTPISSGSPQPFGWAWPSGAEQEPQGRPKPTHRDTNCDGLFGGLHSEELRPAAGDCLR